MVDVDAAAQLNAQITALKKELDAYKSKIKESGVGKFNGALYVAEVTEREVSSLDTAKATAVAEKYNLDWLLKSVIDESKLEADLAQGTFDDAVVKEFADCVNTKKSLVLSFKKKKSGGAKKNAKN